MAEAASQLTSDKDQPISNPYRKLEIAAIGESRFFRFGMAHSICNLLMLLTLYWRYYQWVKPLSMSEDSPLACELPLALECEHIKDLALLDYVILSMLVFSTTLLARWSIYQQLVSWLEAFLFRNLLRFYSLPHADRPSPDVLYDQLASRRSYVGCCLAVSYGFVQLMKYLYPKDFIFFDSKLMLIQHISDLAFYCLASTDGLLGFFNDDATMVEKRIASINMLLQLSLTVSRERTPAKGLISLSTENGCRRVNINVQKGGGVRTLGKNVYQEIMASACEVYLKEVGIYLCEFSTYQFVVIPEILVRSTSVDNAIQEIRHVDDLCHKHKQHLKNIWCRLNDLAEREEEGSSCHINIIKGEDGPQFCFLIKTKNDLDEAFLNFWLEQLNDVPFLFESHADYIKLIPAASYSEVNVAISHATQQQVDRSVEVAEVAEMKSGHAQARVACPLVRHPVQGRAADPASGFMLRERKKKQKKERSESKPNLTQQSSEVDFPGMGARSYTPANDRRFAMSTFKEGDLPELANTPTRLGLDRETGITVFGFIPDDERISWHINPVSLAPFFKNLGKGIAKKGVFYQGPHRASNIKAGGKLGDVRLSSTRLRSMVTTKDFQQFLLLGFSEIHRHGDEYNATYSQRHMAAAANSN